MTPARLILRRSQDLAEAGQAALLSEVANKTYRSNKNKMVLQLVNLCYSDKNVVETDRSRSRRRTNDLFRFGNPGTRIE